MINTLDISNVHDENCPLINMTVGDENISIPLKETTNQTRHLVVIKVLALVDYSTFKQHLVTSQVRAKHKIHSTINKIFDKLNSYYTSIESGKYRYRIKMTRFMISTLPEKLSSKRSENGYFENYLKSMETLLVDKKYDAALAFIFRSREGLGGMARSGTLGLPWAHAVVRLTDVTTSSLLAAHELAHVIGAGHDNPTIVSDGVMLPLPQVGDDVKFSNSSIQEMARGIDRFKERMVLKHLIN